MTFAVHEHRYEAVRQRSGAWLDDVAPLLSSAALTLLGLLFEIALAKRLGTEPRLRKQQIFSFWGPPSIAKAADQSVIDLNSISASTCQLVAGRGERRRRCRACCKFRRSLR
ncbi:MULTISPECIES: hypothetical protein [unclassified Bradyrhizobium]|uniref:hypothetical protein n=2 Tax=Nitrobacteraceae TaxID=41294 RepID=UPI001FF8E9EF|nr:MULTISPECIES: hypothetical protein [unclassified Bradyrhizobium]MCK1483024.1 hypothetical protein [Bradyrhizobium sp. 193]MCK1504394.1 hypothetical protein [Bradyrhizobium sp. 18]MCK1582966.1 hypothetical protein [Bradyrhizobium sp. 168]UPK13874.1 hypothetical protein IVA93_12210 [Bradyrhizobium sp. 155]UPK17211.1 hypothetical protein IVA73_24190 [Bradyrhizobium sp. 131]